MIFNHLKVALRNIIRKPGITLIKVIGLALGITVVILIGLWINSEISFNKNHEHYENIAKVMYHNGNYTNTAVTTGMGTLLRTTYGSYFEKVAMVRARLENRIIAFDDKKMNEDGYFMQPEGPDIFSLKMKYGSREGLKDMNSILLSESLSKKLFGETNPVNQFVMMDANWNLKVTGVYEDLPKNSQFHRAAYFAPLDRYLAGWSHLDVWGNFNMYIFVQLFPGSDMEAISARIKEAFQPYFSGSYSGMESFLHPMSKWHLYSNFENGENVMSDQLKYVWTFGIIGFFVLVLACINFINLSTARSEKYIKEIGIKKTLGTRRGQLVKHFYIESTIVSLIALVLSMIMVVFFLPWFNEITGKELYIIWNSIWFWSSLTILIIITTVLSASYPAFYLSSFKPVKALKGTITRGKLLPSARTTMTITQFAISVILIIGTLIVKKQIQYAKNRPVGYNREGLIMLRPRTPEYNKKYNILLEELNKSNAVYSTAMSNYPVTNTRGWNPFFDWKGKPQDFNPSFNTIRVSYDYGKTIGWEMIDGRDFSREFQTDVSGLIINESALELMNLKNPVGESITWSPPSNSEKGVYTLLGVAKDMVKGSPFEPTRPSVIFLTENCLRWLFIRINPKIGAQEALSDIESIFNKIIPTVPFDYKFLDAEYEAKFKAEERIGNLAGFFAVLAIIISCLGLFGFVKYLVENRTKEIGIRKVNGAKISEVLTMLNRDLVKWIAFASLIGTPIAWFVMNKWLENFDYKTELSWWIFALAGLLTLGIALLTVSWLSWQAARRNPVEALRYE